MVDYNALAREKHSFEIRTGGFLRMTSRSRTTLRFEKNYIYAENPSVFIGWRQ